MNSLIREQIREKYRRNLLTETELQLELNGKTWDDVIWIGNSDYKFGVEDFIRLADFEYDAGYGNENVCTDLMIVGKDWWFTRRNYDGLEWWEFNTIPTEPEKELVPSTLEVIDGCYTLFSYDFEIGNL